MEQRPISIIVITDESTLWLTLEPFFDCMSASGKMLGTWKVEMVSGTEAQFCFSDEADSRWLIGICHFCHLRWFRER